MIEYFIKQKGPQYRYMIVESLKDGQQEAKISTATVDASKVEKLDLVYVKTIGDLPLFAASEEEVVKYR